VSPSAGRREDACQTIDDLELFNFRGLRIDPEVFNRIIAAGTDANLDEDGVLIMGLKFPEEADECVYDTQEEAFLRASRWLSLGYRVLIEVVR